MPINHEDGLFGIDYWLDPESEEEADQEEFGDTAQEIRERALTVLKAGNYKYASLSRWEDGEYVEFEVLTLDDVEADIMTTKNHAWPNPKRPGEPSQPTQTGPHALIDKHGKPVWAWWMYHPAGSSTWMLAGYNGLQTDPSGLMHQGFGYLGPAEMPQAKPVAT